MDPTPAPSYSEVDPFGRLPVEWYPEPPGWLAPTTWTLTIILIAVVATLIAIAYVVGRRSKAAARAQLSQKVWIDLNEFDPRATKRRQRSAWLAREEREADDRRRGGKGGGGVDDPPWPPEEDL